MSDLQDLIARLEAATKGSAELDVLIDAIAVRREKPWSTLAADAEAMQAAIDIPRYTHSLDAAMALVPEGCDYLIGKGKLRQDEPQFGAQIFRPCRGRRALAAKAPIEVIGEGEHDGSLALALCIAALKARLAQEDNGDV